MKSLNELREEFEKMARSNMFDITRLECGEYKTTGRNTFALWAGYWECAKANGVIPKDSSVFKMNEI